MLQEEKSGLSTTVSFSFFNFSLPTGRQVFTLLYMKILKRILIGLLLILLFAAIGGYVFLQTTAPTYSGTITLTGLKAEVEVLYDNYGVPHIYAQNEEDAYYALGYVHAQDRLFQMEMLRRAAGGRLAEILGEDLVKVDKLFRTLGINQFAKEHAQKFLSADTAAFQKAVFAYQKGINQFIKAGDTPIEFSIIGIPKEEFKPEDIYLAVGIMSFGFAEGLKVDPIFQKIKTEYGEAYLADFNLNSPADAEVIKNYKGVVKNAHGDSLIALLNETLNEIPVSLWNGSNGWVVSGDRTASGFPVLENDTHMGFAQPAVWYEAHMEYPDQRFYGHHLAGIPFGLLGTNQFAAWGLTMFENDDSDFFQETVNPQNPNQVKFKDQWEELTTRKEIIKVKGKPDVELAVRSSRHGMLVNGIVENAPKDQAVALYWLLKQTTNEALQSMYMLNHAKTFGEAEQAASMLSAPGLNLMYGDVDGNIAWWACAKLPIRPEHVRTKLFLDGASGNDEYLGFYDFSKNPKSVNPPQGFVYSANNQPDSVDGVLYPGDY
jgi:penicillin amidase